MQETTEPGKNLRQEWQRIHWLQKVGGLCLALSLAAEQYVDRVTPSALWNGPQSLREQHDLVFAQSISLVLIVAGGFLRLRRDTAKESGH